MECSSHCSRSLKNVTRRCRVEQVLGRSEVGELKWRTGRRVPGRAQLVLDSVEAGAAGKWLSWRWRRAGWLINSSGDLEDKLYSRAVGAVPPVRAKTSGSESSDSISPRVWPFVTGITPVTMRDVGYDRSMIYCVILLIWERLLVTCTGAALVRPSMRAGLTPNRDGRILTPRAPLSQLPGAVDTGARLHVSGGGGMGRAASGNGFISNDLVSVQSDHLRGLESRRATGTACGR